MTLETFNKTSSGRPAIVRFWEIIPGASVWLTFVLMFVFAWRLPIVVAVFILLYDLYWVLKIIYLFIHLHSSFLKTRANQEIDWMSRLKEDFAGRWEKISHVIVLPMYKEPENLVRATIKSIATTNYSHDKIFIVLGIEERGGEEDFNIGTKLQAEFGDSFGGFFVVRHPSNIPGEIPGKGSNEAWAMKEAYPRLISEKNINEDNALLTIFDADTQPGADYFAILAHSFLSSPNGSRASFQPIPIFINNFYESSMLARLIGLSSTFWQLIEQSRIDQLITFSSHSMPLKALKEVGFWETDIVSEDSRIFFQLLNHYKGDWRTIPLHYPVYMDAVSGKNFWESLKNVYRQQRRWGWGAENISKFMKDTAENIDFPFGKRIFWLFYLFTGLYSWAASSFIILVFGWLPIFLGGHDFKETVVAYNLPKITGGILNFSMIGFVGLAIIGFFLIQPRLRDFRMRHYLLYVFQWFLTPVTVIFLGSLPALDAQTRLMIGGKLRLGFWRTPKN